MRYGPTLDRTTPTTYPPSMVRVNELFANAADRKSNLITVRVPTSSKLKLL